MSDILDKLEELTGKNRATYQIGEYWSACEAAHDEISQLRDRSLGLETQHHRDSAELRRLCQARDEHRDGRLAALEKLAATETRVAELVEECNRLQSACHETMNNFTVAYKSVRELRARIAELEAQRVPEGFRLVPSIPTPAMLDATSLPGCAASDYAHMLKAAPQPAPSAPADAEGERESFEAWHRDKFKTKHCTGQPTRDKHNGVYADEYGPESQQKMWEVWQARAQLGAVPGSELVSQLLGRAKFLRDKGRVKSPQLMERAAAALTATGGRDELQKKYEDLLYSVASKFPGETRHETALRYIRNAEAGSSGAAAQPAQEGEL